MYFKKLNYNFKINNYIIENYITSYKLNSEKDFFKGLIYHTIDKSNDQLFDIIPSKYKNLFKIAHLKINCDARPHIDNGIKTSINFYLKTNNCKTSFYSFINPKLPKTIPLDISNLKEEDSFVAKKNEVWILDVSKPHSVISINNVFENRIAICLQTGLNFQIVLKMLNEYFET